MRANLRFGGRYRARVALPAALRAVLTPDMVATEMQRYQLFGHVSDVGTHYLVVAQFRGQSGLYDLPAEVQALEQL